MPTTRAVRDLIYRVHINPTPRTQSESTAILRRLHDFGPITFFKIHRPETGADVRHKDGQQALATLVFAHNTKGSKDLHTDITKETLYVTANANIPDAAIIDPYNAQGLKTRKPALSPRSFECRIEHAEGYKEGRYHTGSDILKQLQRNENAGPFTVDRRSIFGEILAKTDAPSGLIHGLLPQIDDRYRDQTYKYNSAKNFEESMEQDWDDITVNNHKLLEDPDIMMKSIDLERSFSDYMTGKELDDKPSPKASTDTEKVAGGQFAVLKDFSLMNMYRDAVQKDTRSNASKSPKARTTSASKRDRLS